METQENWVVEKKRQSKTATVIKLIFSLKNACYNFLKVECPQIAWSKTPEWLIHYHIIIIILLHQATAESKILMFSGASMVCS